MLAEHAAWAIASVATALGAMTGCHRVRGARTRALSEGIILATYALALVLLVEGMIAAPRRRPSRLG